MFACTVVVRAKSFVAEAHRRGLELTLAMNPQCLDTGKNTTLVQFICLGTLSVRCLVRQWYRRYPEPVTNSTDWASAEHPWAEARSTMDADVETKEVSQPKSQNKSRP